MVFQPFTLHIYQRKWTVRTGFPDPDKASPMTNKHFQWRFSIQHVFFPGKLALHVSNSNLKGPVFLFCYCVLHSKSQIILWPVTNCFAE